MLEIEKCTVSDLEQEPNFVTLVQEYAQESSIKGLPEPKGDLALYKKLESSGIIHPFAAYFSDELIGFLLVITSVNPHYGISLAYTETLFVTKNMRKTGAGVKLIDMAESYAKEAGCPGVFIVAPTGSVLAEVLSRKDYTETNRVFFKGFK